MHELFGSLRAKAGDVIEVDEGWVSPLSAPPPPSLPPVDPSDVVSLPPTVRASRPQPATEPARGPRPERIERRGAPRIELESDVSLFSETNFWSGFSEDVSEGGLFVATYDLMPIGTEVMLAFELPTGRRIATRGVVRWLRVPASGEGKPGMGVQFETLLPEDREAILTFVKHREPYFYED